MGFYSFYKIFKDMLRTLFGNKFLKLFIITILIFTIFFVYNECFALSTINPITVDGVTFTFNSSWGTDKPAFVGNMDNITILRYERTNNQYYYRFIRSSYPISLVTSQNGSYTETTAYSYDNQGNQTYYMHSGMSVARSSTSITVTSPSYRI